MLEQQYVSLLLELLDTVKQKKKLGHAFDYAQQATTVAPFREEVHTALINILVAQGQVQAAREHFEGVRARWAEELGGDVSEQFLALAAELRATSSGAEPPSTNRVLNRPLDLTGFVGRSEALGWLETWLGPGDKRLVTLIGLGGVGKTRLALEAADEFAKHTAGSVWFIDLLEVRRSDDFFAQLARTLQPESQAVPALDTVRDVLSETSLLVLDNFEQLLTGGVVHVQTLLDQFPHLTCLVTSRRPLGLRGEQRLTLEPFPPLTKGAELTRVLENSAAKLFLNRATLAQPQFALTHDNAENVATVTRRTEGIPLAIELAAAQLGRLTLEEIVQQLSAKRAAFASPFVDGQPRHKALTYTMQSSYDLLEDAEKALFSFHTVFSGGWTLAASVSRWGNAAEPHLKALLNASLIAEGEESERYRMLETVREFGLFQLSAEQLADYHLAHAEFFAQLLAEMRRQLKAEQPTPAMTTVRQEAANWRVADDWLTAADAADYLDVHLELLYGLGAFFPNLGWLAEGKERLGRFLTAHPKLESAKLGDLHNLHGRVLLSLGEFEAAHAACSSSLSILETVGTLETQADTLLNLAIITARLESFDEAEVLYLKVLEIDRGLGKWREFGNTLTNLGNNAGRQENYSKAADYFGQSIEVLREHGNPMDTAVVQLNAGLNLGNLGRFEESLEQLCGSLHVFTEQAYLPAVAATLFPIAYCLEKLGQPEAALKIGCCNVRLDEQIGNASDLELHKNDLAEMRARLNDVLGEDRVADLCEEGFGLEWQHVAEMLPR